MALPYLACASCSATPTSPPPRSTRRSRSDGPGPSPQLADAEQRAASSQWRVTSAFDALLLTRDSLLANAYSDECSIASVSRARSGLESARPPADASQA